MVPPPGMLLKVIGYLQSTYFLPFCALVRFTHFSQAVLYFLSASPAVPPLSSIPAMNQIIRDDYTRPVSEDLKEDPRTRKIDFAQALGGMNPMN